MVQNNLRTASHYMQTVNLVSIKKDVYMYTYVCVRVYVQY